MFTGIVEEVGRVVGCKELGDAARLEVRAERVLENARLGDSIAVNGVCLTVTELCAGSFTADMMGETLRRSALGALREGDVVNLERALAADGRLGGHIVQGHVDGTAELVSRTPSDHWEVFRFRLPVALERYVVEKGSIAVQGTSLTVSGVGEGWFEVSLIPTTLRETVLGALAVGETVNVEVDILGKYVERLLAARGEQEVTR